MELSTAVSLIKPAIAHEYENQSWADLGCGSGLFTRALLSVLPGATVVAIDQDGSALDQLTGVAGVKTIRANFEKDALPFSHIDGILTANTLHFVRDKDLLISKVFAHLKPSGGLVVVEYDTERPNQWVPFPLPPHRLQAVARRNSLEMQLLESVPSVYHGKMYSALLRGIS